jgi:hypothetical protein
VRSFLLTCYSRDNFLVGSGFKPRPACQPFFSWSSSLSSRICRKCRLSQIMPQPFPSTFLPIQYSLNNISLQYMTRAPDTAIYKPGENVTFGVLTVVWKLLWSGMWRRVYWQKCTGILKQMASVFTVSPRRKVRTSGGCSEHCSGKLCTVNWWNFWSRWANVSF